MKKFYYVYNRAQSKPIKRHKTLDKAIDEAVRLACLEKKHFYVLAPVAHIISDRQGEICEIDTQMKESKE